MDEDECLARFGLRPDPAELPEIRELLRTHTELERTQQGDTFVMKLLCVQLFAAGLLDDVALIWQAKNASFDAACSLDVQLLCGAGFDETEAYLSANGPDDALDYLRQCREARDFEDFTPAARMAEYERYYGV